MKAEAHSHSTIETICDLRFNFAVFNTLLIQSSEDSKKKSTVRRQLKEVYWTYKARELAISAARITENDNIEDAIVEEEDQSDSELYA